jgi:hypothetical protein
MKIFKIFLTLFLLIGLFYLGSLFFPKTYHINRSVVINKPIDTVFHFMQDLHNWDKWSLWNKETDTTLKLFYGKRSDSLGGRQYFEGDILGEGRFLIDRYKYNQLLGYNLYMNKGQISANGTFLFDAINSNQTTLQWVDSGNVGNNPIFRYMMYTKVNATQKAFDKGLARIKAALEL